MAAVTPDAVDAAPVEDDDEPGLYVEDDEPRPDDGPVTGDRIELVRTGIIRVWIGDKRYRLRRPFFGEFKTLRLAIEDMNDEIQAESDKVSAVSRRVQVDAANRPDGEDPETFIAWQAEARRKTVTATRHLTVLAEENRIEWWEKMWDLLSVDGKPDDWPAWVTDATIGNRVMTHWRESPLGRG